jgi:hypothetical protein
MMMTPSEIHAECLSVEQLMTSRGFHRPEVAFFINFFAGKDFSLKVEMRTSESWESSISIFPDVQTEGEIPHLFEKAREWVAAQKPPKELRKEQFIASLGRVIDEGNALGLEVDFMNPLVESMRKLSENVLEYKPKEAAE